MVYIALSLKSVWKLQLFKMQLPVGKFLEILGWYHLEEWGVGMGELSRHVMV